MLIARILLIAALFFVSFASKETNNSRLSHVLGLNGERSSRVKKREEEPEYFEQCRVVNLWKEHLGHVSVLAFLDPSWHYSFRQAVMLNVLSLRLRKSGFPDIRFFVISPPLNLMQDDDETEDGDDEIEAWRQIATMFPDTENFVNPDVHIFKKGESEMIFLQDGPQFRMWKRFRASRDQVIVVDRCGRLTYQVIVPWSILHFPYVKAAILSTYQEDPCGECDPSMYKKMPDYKEYLPDLTNGTEKETDPRKADNIDADPIWTIERLENVTTLHLNESLEEERGASSITLPVQLDEATDSTDRLDLASVTELSVKPGTAYQSNDKTESSIGESHPGTAGSHGEVLTNSSHASETIATFESQQQDVPAREVLTLEKNNSANYGETGDRVLMLDEPVTYNVITSDGVPATEMTISDTAEYSDDDEVSSSDGNANISSDNLSERGQNDSVGKSSEIEDAASVDEGVQRSLPLPLRVIMYAPHVHGNGKERRKYTHLILKTDNPDYHGHLDSGISVTSPTDLAEENDKNLLRTLISSQRYSDSHGNGHVHFQDSDLQIVNSKEYDQTRSKINNGHREDTDPKYIFDQNENPGLYGEIADYWRSHEESDITDRNETSNDNYNNSTISYNEQHRSNASDHANFSKSSETDKSYSNANITIDTNMEDSVGSSNVVGLNETNSLKSNNEQVDREDETRNKLNEHYNKLLTWIDYRLNK